MGHPARYWRKDDDGRLRCELCPRFCRLRDGQAGHCYVRSRHGDALELDTYGRSSGFCVDPVEKKPLNHFLPGTPILSFGTAGCNLACAFCQNWDITRSRETDTLSDRAEPALVAEAAVRAGCDSVAFTYNDPVIFLEYAVDVAAACRERGVRTVAKTAAYICPEPAEEFFRHMDAASIDLKAFTEDFYRRYCGGSLQPVLDAILHVRHRTQAWLELTTLLIPGLNDSDEELDRATRWVVKELGPDVPMHFTAFHPDHRMLDRPRTPRETLLRARDIALGNGVHYPYTGNHDDERSNSTYCPGCRAVVIGRSGYDLTAWQLKDDGRCAACGTRIPGVFTARPGTWGSRRQRLDMERVRRELEGGGA